MAETHARMETDQDQNKERDEEIDKLLKIITIIINELGSAKAQTLALESEIYTFDLDASDEIAGFLMTVFTCLRKKENDKQGYERFLNYSAKV